MLERYISTSIPEPCKSRIIGIALRHSKRLAELHRQLMIFVTVSHSTGDCIRLNGNYMPEVVLKHIR
jgi:hypothetical protein